MDDKENKKIYFTPSMHVGLILDVPNTILSLLIRFDDQYSFLENFFSEFDGEIIALINGNSLTPYYDLNELLVSTITYLRKKANNDNKDFFSSFKEYFSSEKKILFDENCLLQIIKGMEKDDKLNKLKYSKTIYYQILQLKNILKEKYSSFLPNLFENFNKFISKPSSIRFSLRKIFEIFMNYSQYKYIIIISDGNSLENDEKMDNLIFEAETHNITVVTLLLPFKPLSKKKNLW